MLPYSQTGTYAGIVIYDPADETGLKVFLNTMAQDWTALRGCESSGSSSNRTLLCRFSSQHLVGFGIGFGGVWVYWLDKGFNLSYHNRDL